MGDETKGDEILKRLWQMPPKPHAKITPKAQAQEEEIWLGAGSLR